MASGQFAVAAHALALLAYAGEEGVSSEFLASSIGTHPAFVRRIVRKLATAGLVDGKPGPGGGYRLARKPDEIRLSDVFDITELEGVLTPSASEPGASCPVGCGMRAAFADVNAAASEGVRRVLATQTVADLSARAVHEGRRRRKRANAPA